jgi:hypothetical protein
MPTIETAIEDFVKTFLSEETERVAMLRVRRSAEAKSAAERLNNVEIFYHGMFVLGGFSELGNPDKTRLTSWLSQEIGLQISEAVIAGTTP